MDIPILADKNCEIAKAYGVYKEDEGIAFRYSRSDVANKGAFPLLILMFWVHRSISQTCNRDVLNDG